MYNFNGLKITGSIQIGDSVYPINYWPQVAPGTLAALGVTYEDDPLPAPPTQAEIAATHNIPVYEQIHRLELQDVMGRPVREAIAADPTHLAYGKYKALDDQIAALRATLV